MMFKFSKQEFELTRKMSEDYKRFAVSYETVEQEEGDQIEQRAFGLFNFLDFQEVGRTAFESIANHELKVDIWVKYLDVYYPFQIKKSIYGAAKHNSLSSVQYTDEKGRVRVYPTPPCLVLNKTIRGIDFILEIIDLFKAADIFVALKEEYADAYLVYKKLKGKLVPMVLFQKGKNRLLSPAQVTFLLQCNLVRMVDSGIQF